MIRKEDRLEGDGKQAQWASVVVARPAVVKYVDTFSGVMSLSYQINNPFCRGGRQSVLHMFPGKILQRNKFLAGLFGRE